MHRLIGIAGVVFLAFVGLVLLGERAAAGGPGTVVYSSNRFSWHIKWGQQTETDVETNWSLRTMFTETVQILTSPMVFTPAVSGIVTATVGEGGWFTSTRGMSEANFPWALSLNVQNAATSVATTDWRRENCTRGPEYFAEINEFPNSNDSAARVIVHNTTGKTLHIAVLSEAQVRTLGSGGMYLLKMLPPDGWEVIEQRVSVGSTTGYIALITELNPGFDLSVICSSFGWNFPPMINLDLTPVADKPIPTPTPTVEPVPTPPALELEIKLQPGWNLIGGTASMPASAKSLFQELNDRGFGPRQVVRWQNGAWESHVRGMPDLNNFALEEGRGYFVHVSRPGYWYPGLGASVREERR